MGVHFTEREPGRNDPCPCGSELKFKKCHGDEIKKATVNKFANELMNELIEEEKEKLCKLTEPELSDVRQQNGQLINPPEDTLS